MERPNKPPRTQGLCKVVKLSRKNVLESLSDYYYSEYIPAWALNETTYNRAGRKIFIRKDNNLWFGWEGIGPDERPDIAAPPDLLIGLPTTREYRTKIKRLRKEKGEEAEDHFWEYTFSYKFADEVKIADRTYKIEWS